MREVNRSADPHILLDTSALLAFIEDEPGADRVENVLKSEKVILPWPVLLEAYYGAFQEAGQAEADHRFALIKQLKADFLWDMDESTMLTAAELKARHRISMADALIAAFTLRSGAVLMHKDPEYESLADVIPQEALPYK